MRTELSIGSRSGRLHELPPRRRPALNSLVWQSKVARFRTGTPTACGAVPVWELHARSAGDQSREMRWSLRCSSRRTGT